MKKVTDLKENECILCYTKEEFKAILELNPMNDVDFIVWDLKKDNTVYYPFRHRRTGGFADLKYAKQYNHTIHPTSDFLEPTYQLTKSQIIEIAENGSLVKELFPDCFEVELKVGKWYKGFSFEGSSFLGVYGKKESSDIIYGFWNGKWSENKNGLIFSKYAKSFEPVIEALKEEKRKRYKLHTDNIKWLSGEPIETLKGDLCYFEDNKLYASGGSKRWCLFNNGKWAETIKTPTEVIKVIETYGKDKLITLIEAYERNNK